MSREQGAYQYSSKERRILMGASTALMLLGGVGVADGVKQLVHDLPTQDRQITGEINTRYNAPSESAVKEARERWLSDMCDDRSCTDQEIRTVERIVTRDQEIKKEIDKGISDATGTKKIGRTLQSSFGSLGITYGVFGIYTAFRRRRSI